MAPTMAPKKFLRNDPLKTPLKRHSSVLLHLSDQVPEKHLVGSSVFRCEISCENLVGATPVRSDFTKQ